ncbi:YraN family protein [Amycolatopsis sp. SID8362]|uniref:YraN family protein n=1 Tax=Amycolatopsis sp. SID8362 TaxID=2690346 RepID=UPI00136D91AD|nr:YraN family protein [Amycolatopsis sp. SID8362]NBH09484.1 YraN family protein [Amycolatopsis sp. SID8362]NED46176.1 YraN family protein [Amycolatopsis sp. SID8362]
MTGTDELARHRRDLGAWGEDLALRYLQDRGLVLLARNWRCREGELDLVFTDRTRVIVCEVKTRTSTEFGLQTETVTEKKAGRVRRATERWLRDFRIPWCPVRYDVITILAEPGTSPRLQHLEAAF